MSDFAFETEQNVEIISIPLRTSEDVVEIPVNELPEDSEEVIDVLRDELPPLSIWHRIALEYHRKGDEQEFLKIMNVACHEVLDQYTDTTMKTLISNTLGAYYTQKASKTTDQESRNDYFRKAASYYNISDNIDMSIGSTFIGKGFLMLKQNDINRADGRFKAARGSDNNSIPAILGKACTLFNSGKYNESLELYKQAIRRHPTCQVDIRIGLAHCYYRLGMNMMSVKCFQRVLELEPNNAEAYVGLSILAYNGYTPELENRSKTENDLNEGKSEIEIKKERSQKKMKLLQKAYSLNKEHTVVLMNFAEWYFYKKRYDRVKIICDTVYEKTENDEIKAESCYILGRSYHSQGLFEEAEKSYLGATKFSPKHSLARFRLGQIYIKNRNYKGAIKEFEEVIQIAPENYDAIKMLGILYSFINKRAEAQKYLTDATRISPNDPENWVELGSVLELTNPKKALECYLTAVQIWETIDENTLDEDDDKDLDEKEKEKMNIEKNKENEDENENEKEKEKEDVDEQEEKQNKEEQKLLKKEVRRKKAILKKRKKIPFEVWNNIGSLRQILEDYDGALEAYKNALLSSGEESKTSERNTTVYYNMARLYEQESLFNQAEEIYLEILKEHPNYVDCYFRLGAIDEQRGNFDKAEEKYTTVVKEIDKNNTNAWTLIANLHLKKNNINSALEKFNHARVVHNSNNKDTYSLISIGNVYYSLASFDLKKDRHLSKFILQHQRAIGFFKKALEYEVSNIYAAHGIGVCLASLGYLDEAREIFIKVLETAENFPDVRINLAHLNLVQGQFTNSIKLYQNSSSKFFFDKNPRLLFYISRAHFQNKKFNEALIYIQKVLHLNPKDKVSWFNLAVIQKKYVSSTLKKEKTLKELERAKKMLKQAIENFEYLLKLDTKELGFYHIDAVKEQIKTCEKLKPLIKNKIVSAKKNEKFLETRRKRDYEMELLRQQQEREEQEKIKRELEEKQRKTEEIAKQTRERFDRLKSQWVSHMGKRNDDEDADDLEIVSDNEYNFEINAKDKKKKRKKKKKKKKKKKRKRKKISSDSASSSSSSSDSDSSGSSSDSQVSSFSDSSSNNEKSRQIRNEKELGKNKEKDNSDDDEMEFRIEDNSDNDEKKEKDDNHDKDKDKDNVQENNDDDDEKKKNENDDEKKKGNDDDKEKDNENDDDIENDPEFKDLLGED